MNPKLVQFLSNFIPSRTARHAFRNRYATPQKKDRTVPALPLDLDKRLHAIEAQLSALVRFCVQKEIYPEFGKKLCVEFPVSEAILLHLNGHTWANAGAGASVKAQYIREQISLATAMIHILPDEALFKIFRDLIALCAVGDANYKAICNHWCWVLWRTGRHEENLQLMEGFFPSGVEIPQHLFRRFIASAYSSRGLEFAKDMMSEYHKKYLTKDLWKSYATARLSADLRKRDAEIDFVCKIGDRIIEAQRGGEFEKLLQGRRVAVVGNGPQEVGSGNGAKIDSYDIVIRFNDFPETEEFSKDYGSKTDVWVRSLWVNASRRKSVPNIIIGEALHSEYPDLKVMKEAVKMNPQAIFAIPAEVYYSVHNSGINHPTNGTLILAWIKSICPEFSSNDCYGFSFKAKIPPKSLTHYYDSPALHKGTAHNLDKERAYLRELFGMKGE